MEVLFGLIFLLIGICYSIWVFVSPFVVNGLNTRITELEKQVKELQRKLAAGRLPEKTVEKPSVVSPEPIPPIVTSPPMGAPVAAASAVEVEPEPRLKPPVAPSRPVPQYNQRREEWRKPVEQVAPPAPLVPPSIPVVPPAVPTPVPVPARPVDPETTPYPVAKPQPAPIPMPTRAPARVAAAVPVPVTHKSLTATSEDEPSTLEEILAGKWLTWVGALAVIIGAGFGFKYAIENHWIGNNERVLIGILTGLACFAGGAYAMTRKYRFLAQGLTGSGLGVLYLSLYAAFGWYNVLSYETAFLGMILTTTLGLSFAGYFNVQPTAVLGMLGGFLTPAMLWPSHDPLWTLFPYLLMLDLGVLLIAGVRRWAGLEIVAFCGTLIIWFSWHRQFYDGQHLLVTAGFMTAFFALFALLSVWHNVIRRRKATAADFFLIMATPTAYFATLYALTFQQLEHWQSEFALMMMLFYLAMAVLARMWHPEGKSVIAALAGLSATFLIISVPLELTGHYVTIIWITQAVLLVELGLYFREKALLWTGLALLAKVQGILLIYFLGTLADPVHFQTQFVRIQLHLIGRPEIPLDAAQGWMSLINGRSLSYLADVIAFALLAWELGRRKDDPELRALWPQNDVWQMWINIAVPIMALTMIILETFVWGFIWKWDAATIVSAWTIWTSVFACGTIFWSKAFRAQGLEGLGWILCLLVGGFLFFTSVDAIRFSVLRGELVPLHRLHAMWLFNPRGMGVLTAILASAVIAWIYQWEASRKSREGHSDQAFSTEQLACWFGSCAYLLGLGLVLMETRVWAIHHDWLVATLLTACVTWVAVFMQGAIAWRVTRRDQWVETLIYPTLILMEFFLVCSALKTLATLAIPSNVPPQRISELASLTIGNWWFYNPRAFGFIIATLGCLLGAEIARRIPRLAERHPTAEVSLSGVLTVAAFLNSLAMVWLETYAWGKVHGWDPATIVAVWTIWTAPFACGAIYWSEATGSHRIERMGWALWIVLACLISINSAEALAPTVLESLVQLNRVQALWLLNPRGISFLTVILAGVIVSYIYGALPRRNAAGDWALPDLASENLSALFAGGMFFLGLWTVLLETWVYSGNYGWLPPTRLSACASWVSLFMLGAVLWRVERATPWVERLVTATFAILCAFLIPSTIRILVTLNSDVNAGTDTGIDWWLINPRGLGYLAAVTGCGLGALCYRRLAADSDQPSRAGQGTQLGVAAYVLGLWTVLLETTAWGYPHGWLVGTLVAASAIWIALFLVGLVGWSVRHKSADFDSLVVLVFVGLILTLFALGAGSTASVNRHEVLANRAFRLAVENWILNPRFIAFLVSILATGISARLYRGPDHKWKIADATTSGVDKTLNLWMEFAMVTYLAGLAMFSLEVFVQGTSRDWHTATSLAITLVWTTYATLTLIGGIYWKSGWVRAFSLGLLVITVGKVFLFDVWHLDTVIRVFAFISLGVALLLVSFLYRRYRERIRSWIVPVARPPEAIVAQPDAE
ncbi:MAG: hypothetical protein JWN70_316 [Planctomycetaceae bacterium]|nr:hypothetical protein [Planctomycetaceae bacterium]